MAPQQSADGKIKAFERPPFAEGLKRILGAGRGEPAGWGLERGDAQLIKAYQQYEGKDKYFAKQLHLANIPIIFLP